jgi:hypothetical protein
MLYITVDGDDDSDDDVDNDYNDCDSDDDNDDYDDDDDDDYNDCDSDDDNDNYDDDDDDDDMMINLIISLLSLLILYNLYHTYLPITILSRNLGFNLFVFRVQCSSSRYCTGTIFLLIERNGKHMIMLSLRPTRL